MSYDEFMVVGIDEGISCCNECGTLVPNSRIGRHHEWHERIRALLDAQRGA
jgi:hypothetical protein